MNAKLFFLSLFLFLTSAQIFGQRIPKPGNLDAKALESSMRNHEASNNAGGTYKNKVEINEELRLELSCDANLYSDEALVIFNNSNAEEGSQKLFSIYAKSPELWSVKNGLKYSISFLGGLDSIAVVPIAVKAGLPGKYTVTASQLESFGTNIEIGLEDRSEGTYIILGDTPTYTFQVSVASTLTNRFYLHFTNKAAIPPKDLTAIQNRDAAQNFRMYAADGAIQITSLQAQSGKITVFDMWGRIISTSHVESGATTRIDMHGNTGVYIVSMFTGKGKSNTKILVH